MTNLPDEHDTEDAATLAFYDEKAVAYAAHRDAKRHPTLDQFIERLGPGATVLELGCGGGQDAEVMLAAGLRVTATDGSPALAAQAAARLKRRVKVMTFVQLREQHRYDGVWANASL
ncbi:MAG: SAM-dependent methyltransferase, partial [Caulobacter sp.]|nr:SAM-dependent methyltransferase [Caulobacter sp.]